jgi:hypothetical protein
MKKRIFTVYLLTIIVCYAYSQSLSLSNSHGPISPNTTIVQPGSTDSLELVTYLNVKNISNNQLKVLCKKEEIKILDSTEMLMCWAGGCYPSTVFVSPKSLSMAAGSTNTGFSGHYIQSSGNHIPSGESIVRWVFYDMSDSNDSVSVTIKYLTYPTGIEDIKATQGKLSDIYPNPVCGDAVCNYAITNGSQGAILIRDILGTTVDKQSLPSTRGKATISTTNLTDGIYFCSLLVDGKIFQTRKLMVKH